MLKRDEGALKIPESGLSQKEENVKRGKRSLSQGMETQVGGFNWKAKMMRHCNTEKDGPRRGFFCLNRWPRNTVVTGPGASMEGWGEAENNKTKRRRKNYHSTP